MLKHLSRHSHLFKRRIPCYSTKSGFKDQDLASKDYWNEYHTRQRQKEWFIGWNNELDVPLQNIVQEIWENRSELDNSPFSVLNVGCGTSKLLIDLQNNVNFPLDCWNVDYSPVCVQEMQNKFPNHGKWIQMDILDESAWNSLPLFDVIIDKGTLDALLRQPTLPTIFPTQVQNHLKPWGTYIQITNEEEREQVLSRLFPRLSFATQILEDVDTHYTFFLYSSQFKP